MPQVKKKSFIQKNGLIAVWTMAGFMATGYIGFLATGNGNPDSQQANIAQNKIQITTAQTSPVLEKVATLSAKLENLTIREKKLSKEVTYLKDAFGVETSALPEKKEKKSQKPLDDLPKSDDTPQKVVSNISASVNPPKPYDKVTINMVPLTEEEHFQDLSLGAKPVDQYGIYLASARSIESLEKHWNSLKKTSADLTKGLEAHYINKSANNLPLYTLVAGPFDKMSDARGHCEKLSQDNVDCQGTRFRIDRKTEQVRTAGALAPQ